MAATQDSTRLSKINGYGSKAFADNKTFSIIQTVKTTTKDNIKNQLPANFAMASAAFAPKELSFFCCFSGFSETLLSASSFRTSSSDISCAMSVSTSFIRFLLFFMFLPPAKVDLII